MKKQLRRIALAVAALTVVALIAPAIPTVFAQVGTTVKNGFVGCSGVNCDNLLKVGGTLQFTGRGTVTQATSITTGVTVNATSGTITTVSQTIAAGAEAEFTVTNSTVISTDTIVVNLADTASGAGGPFIVQVTAVTTGTFNVSITNTHAANAGNSVLKINFVVLHSIA